MRSFIVWLIVIILVIIGIVAYKNANDDAIESGNVVSPSPTAVVEDPFAGTELTRTEVTVNGKNFSFNPSTITVNKGDRVVLTFVNEEGTHDLKIDEFNVGTRVIKTGENDVVEFIADKTGSFEYYCSIGTHRVMGMKGTLVVQEVAEN